MSAVLHKIEQRRLIDSDGIADGASIFFYLTGTSTLAPIYSDAGLSIPRANPVVVSSGAPVPDIYLDSGVTYRRVIVYLNGTTENMDPYLSGFDSVLVSFTQNGTGAVARSVQDELRDTVSVKQFGAKGDGITDDRAAIVAAEIYCTITGSNLRFPAGDYRCNSGITKATNVDWLGSGRDVTWINYYGNSICIDALGGVAESARVMCKISNMGFRGSNGGALSQGIRIGYNMRGVLLDTVRFDGFGFYGINFHDQNWDLELHSIKITSCGTRTSMGAGVYVNPAIPAGSFNAIYFSGHWNIEFCGYTDSPAGGINLRSNTAQRKFKADHIDCEGNYGLNEVLIENFASVDIDMYMEINPSAGTAPNAILFKGVQGRVTGFIRGTGGALKGIRAVAGVGGNVPCDIVLDCLHLSDFVEHVSGTDCKITSRNVWTYVGSTVIYTPDPTCQYLGDHCPQVGAVKSVPQVITTGTFQKVTFDTELYDTTSSFINSTFTPVTVGRYSIKAQVGWDAAAISDKLIIAIYVNGSLYRETSDVASTVDARTLSISTDLTLINTTDTVEIYVRQTSGSNKNVVAATSQTYFSAHYIGRTL